jgi:hypothetical protein
LLHNVKRAALSIKAALLLLSPAFHCVNAVKTGCGFRSGKKLVGRQQCFHLTAMEFQSGLLCKNTLPICNPRILILSLLV